MRILSQMGVDGDFIIDYVFRRKKALVALRLLHDWKTGQLVKSFCLLEILLI